MINEFLSPVYQTQSRKFWSNPSVPACAEIIEIGDFPLYVNTVTKWFNMQTPEGKAALLPQLAYEFAKYRTHFIDLCARSMKLNAEDTRKLTFQLYDKPDQAIVMAVEGLRRNDICAFKFEDLVGKYRTMELDKTIENLRSYNAEVKKTYNVLNLEYQEVESMFKYMDRTKPLPLPAPNTQWQIPAFEGYYDALHEKVYEIAEKLFERIQFQNKSTDTSDVCRYRNLLIVVNNRDTFWAKTKTELTDAREAYGDILKYKGFLHDKAVHNDKKYATEPPDIPPGQLDGLDKRIKFIRDMEENYKAMQVDFRNFCEELYRLCRILQDKANAMDTRPDLVEVKDDLRAERLALDDCRQRESNLEKEIEGLQDEVNKKDREFVSLKTTHEAEMDDLKNKTIKEQEALHQAEIEKLKREHGEAILKLKSDHTDAINAEILKQKQLQDDAIKSTQATFQLELDTANEKIAFLQATIVSGNDQLKKLNEYQTTLNHQITTGNEGLEFLKRELEICNANNTNQATQIEELMTELQAKEAKETTEVEVGTVIGQVDRGTGMDQPPTVLGTNYLQAETVIPVTRKVQLVALKPCPSRYRSTQDAYSELETFMKKYTRNPFFNADHSQKLDDMLDEIEYHKLLSANYNKGDVIDVDNCDLYRNMLLSRKVIRAKDILNEGRPSINWVRQNQNGKDVLVRTE